MATDTSPPLFPAQSHPALAAYLTARAETVPASGCWVWTGAMTSGGGVRANRVFGDQYGSQSATYLAWVAAHRGPPPDGERVRHTCGCPRCINPDHLTTSAAQRQQRTAQRAARKAARQEAREAAQKASREAEAQARHERAAARVAAKAARQEARRAEREARQAATARKRFKPKAPRSSVPKLRKDYSGPETVQRFDAGSVRIRGTVHIGRYRKLDARAVYNIQNPRPGPFSLRTLTGLPQYVLDAVLKAPRARRFKLPCGDWVFEMEHGARVPLDHHPTTLPDADDTLRQPDGVHQFGHFHHDHQSRSGHHWP